MSEQTRNETDKPRNDAGRAGVAANDEASRAEPGAAVSDDAAAAEPTPEEQVAELKDRLLRTLAEMENLRSRTAREVEDARKYAITGFARDLLEAADNLGRAL